jgi:CheY-like chemotaxis protein
MEKTEDKTILVVDDEEDIRDYLSTVLEDAGFRVVTAEDGIAALQCLKREVPDFISLDLVMPGKSGMRFLREMRRNPEWAGIPFVVVTAHAHDALGRDDLQDILSGRPLSGPSVYLEKPVKPDQYVRLICDRLGIERKVQCDDLSLEDLRNELLSLARGADRDRLQKAIRVLRGD